MESKDSNETIAAYAQHEPQFPWSLIRFTFPYALQSTEYWDGPSARGVGSTSFYLEGIINPSKIFANSSMVIKLNLL